MTRLTCVFFALLLANSAAHAQQDDGDTNAIDDTPHITILGAATAEVVPDIAEISLGVAFERAGAAEATNETSRIAQRIVDAAKAQGVEARDISTQSVSLSQVFDDLHDANGRYTGRRARGFLASNTIAIRVRALDKAGVLAQSLIEKGANSFNGITFSVEHPEPVLDQLLAAAVRDAKRKATISAEASGVKLGRVLLIDRPRANDDRPSYKSRAVPAPTLAAAPPPMPLEAGTQTLSAEIDVTWALEN